MMRFNPWKPYKQPGYIIKTHLNSPEIYITFPDINKTGFDVPYGNMTLGVVETIYRLKDKDLNGAKDKNEAKKIQTAKNNWHLCYTIATRSGAAIPAFETILKQMVDEQVAHNRNELAHGGPISQNIAQQLRDTIIGRKDKAGILYRLAEYLDPKK